MLHDICQELTRENVSDFLFLCEHKIARSQCDQIKSPRDLFYALEQLKLVGPDSLHFLSSKLTEIRRQDLAQKVDEHCQRHGMQHLGGDRSIWSNFDSRVGQVTSSFATALMPDRWQESSNHVVSYKSARVLESDNAEPLRPSKQHASASEHLRVAQTTLSNSHLYARRLPADNDMPCYAMDKNPRGNMCLHYIIVHL